MYFVASFKFQAIIHNMVFGVRVLQYFLFVTLQWVKRIVHHGQVVGEGFKTCYDLFSV